MLLEEIAWTMVGIFIGASAMAAAFVLVWR
jgi:hypothetical protein